MAIFTSTSRIKNERDITAEYDLSEWNNCVRHGCKPQIIEFTYGSRNNKDTSARCAMDDSEQCLVYPADKRKWNKFHPNLNTESIENLEFVETCAETKKTTYHFVKPNEKIKPEFWERWEITL